MSSWARHERAESLDELEVSQSDVCPTVALRSVEMETDVFVIETLVEVRG